MVHKTNDCQNPTKENELFRIINRMMDSHEAIGKFRPPKKHILIILGREFMSKSVTADKIAEFIHQGMVFSKTFHSQLLTRNL